jgi:hypothetical protein
MERNSKDARHLYGYLVHYAIYFYFLYGRLPNSIDEFKKFVAKQVGANPRLRLTLSQQPENLRREFQLVWSVIHKKPFLKLVQLVKQLVGDNHASCKLLIEHTFNFPKLKDTKTKVKVKFQTITPDIVVVCPKKVLVIELKSGNRKLWKKYRKQLKTYCTLLRGFYKRPTFGILFYFKSGYIWQCNLKA